MKPFSKIDNYGDAFDKEIKVIERLHSLLDNNQLHSGESLSELKELLNRYESLLKQSIKILKIGDSTQRRLIKTQEELQKTNSDLDASYRNFKILSSIGRTITSSLDIKQIISCVYEYTKTLMPVDIIAIGVAEEDKPLVKYKFCIKDGDYLPSMVRESFEEDTLTKLCYSEKEEIVINDADSLEFSKYMPQVVSNWDFQPGSLTLFSLKVESRFIGILTVKSRQKNAYNENDINILRTLASYVAIAIDNADAYRTITRKNKQLQDNIEKINLLNAGIEAERQKSEKLLLNILPHKIANRLKSGEEVIADHFEDSSVLFADIAGFTVMSSLIASPDKLVEILNDIFISFDSIASHYKLEKIKTIGDCYMLAGGIPEYSGDHLSRLAKASLEMIESFNSIRDKRTLKINLRVGIHSGSVVAGVIGKNKFVYDLWGDTVNVSSRMESHGIPGKVHCSDAVFHKLKNNFDFEDRGEIEIKGKGKMHTYILLKEKSY